MKKADLVKAIEERGGRIAMYAQVAICKCGLVWRSWSNWLSFDTDAVDQSKVESALMMPLQKWILTLARYICRWQTRTLI